MAMPFLSRREAEYNEKRVQTALRTAGPQALKPLIGVFEQINKVVSVEKPNIA